MARIDLHLHTTCSDGSCTPAEVIARAQKANVTALAITDHDIVTGLPEAMEAGRNAGIDVIPGIEVSSRHGTSEVHILGYYLDWRDPTLLAHLDGYRQARHRRNPLIIEKLRALGIDITYEEVKTLAGTDAVGRPHIARVLMDKGYVGSSKEAFDRYLADGAAAHVPRELPSPAEAIQIIRAAHGIPVLAHPSWVDGKDGIYALCAQLKDAGLGGIEVHYSTHKPDQTAQYLDTAQRLGLLVTGGSDFHGVTKPDIEVGTGRGQLKVPEKLLEPLRAAAATGR
ncbi:MAG TPA: PHP domain-containing protein [Nitrospirales bacterium]|nr:PHP domain-containing protein [Nitrospirales bacterium]